jgi:hypothetical protein
MCICANSTKICRLQAQENTGNVTIKFPSIPGGWSILVFLRVIAAPIALSSRFSVTFRVRDAKFRVLKMNDH